MSYHISRFVDCGLDEAIERATAALAAHGFGVLTEIDARATLKRKLDLDFRPYRILGACNPQFAHQALQSEDKIGVLMPCNVVVQQHDDGRVEVSAMDPAMMVRTTGNEALADLGRQTSEAMRRVIESL
jgi:uncharacterized protein (DUF302 family)